MKTKNNKEFPPREISAERPFLEQWEEEALRLWEEEGDRTGLLWLEENIYQDPDLLLMLTGLPITTSPKNKT